MATPPGLGRRFAAHWLLVGSLILAGDAVFAIAHYVFGAAVHDRHTGETVSESALALTLVILAMGGLLLATIGGAYLWLNRKRPEESPFRY